MTATAGPGISLMAEFAGLGYYVEIPGVIWDIQRVGPSTGLPTRTSQGDISFVAWLSHGDTRHPMLIPCNPAECFIDGERRLRPGRAVADAGVRDDRPRPRHEQLDVGAVPVSREAAEPRQGADRRKTSTGWAALRATKTWTAMASDIARCRAPTILRRAWFARGSGHNEKAQYSERPDDYANNMDRLARKFDTARTLVPQSRDGAQRRQRGRHHRLRHFASRAGRDPRPVADRVRREGRLPAAARLSVHARDARVHRRAQARLRRRPEPRRPDAAICSSSTSPCPTFAKLRSVRHYNGLPIDARSVTDEIISQEGK